MNFQNLRLTNESGEWTHLDNLSINELSKLNSIIIDLINMKQSAKDKMAIVDFSPGDTVYFTGKSGRGLRHGARGIIKKTKKTRVTVQFPEYGRFDVPASMLSKEKEKEDI